jgi:outer membrane protein OmpA-like peptidoglycan-associated protein
MKIHNFMAGLASAALATMLGTAAYAEGPAKHKGLYVSGALGANWANDSDVSGGASGEVDFDVNWVGAVAVGYGFGNGVRLEGELSHRRSDADDFSGVSLSGKAKATGFMANVLYDFDVSPRFVPYLGLGAGLARVDADRITALPAADSTDDEDTVFAWQAIAGVAVPLNQHLDLTADYRYFDAGDVDLTSTAGVSIDTEYASHSVMIGLRYRFGAPKRASPPRPAAAVAPPMRPKPAPAPAPKPMAQPKPKPAPPPPRSFIVFFDWDRANIRPDAQRVLDAAAAYAKRRGLVRVNLAGHADRSGPAKYNMGLSLRRARAVRAAFLKLGVSGRDISLVGRGESQPLVATADGVREPRNRRVEIAF